MGLKIAEQEVDEIETIDAEDETPSVEVGGDLDAAVAEEHDVARAEDEGMLGVPAPVPEKSTYEKRLEAERADAIERAIVEVCEAQEIAMRKKARAESLALDAKDAKDSLKAADEDLRDAAHRLRKLREGEKPDPERHPLFDKPDADKAEINAAFPAPDPIQPLPPEDFAEHLRRKQRDTPLSSLGLDLKTDKVLEELGLKTVLDLVNKFDAVFEGGAEYTTIKGVTPRRLEKITEALDLLTRQATVEWDVSHPIDEPPDEWMKNPGAGPDDTEDVAEAERRLSDPDQVPIPFDQAIEDLGLGGDEEE